MSAQKEPEIKPLEVNTLTKKFAVILKRLIIERGITISELADATGILPNTLHQLTMARGIPKVQTLIPLARFFHVSIEEIIGEEKLNYQVFPSLRDTSSKIDLKLEWHKKYFLQCVEVYDKIVKEKNIPFIDTKTSVKAISEIYEFSLSKKLNSPDQVFAEWIIKQYF
ncbi:helix-turn-helix domain-containing protein [Fastidiosibacter lacustris]|uniref:helix-turn-helix domain-containing protein n=1 Tax=Fastidiosibacter lacustris TaxID=2056695 RepID=UPI000E3562C9|nr:helix-turn-helix transcriptional regulator [Fastidiosibacter lacustris]